MKILFLFSAIFLSSMSYGMCNDYHEKTEDLFNLATDVYLAEVVSAEQVEGINYKSSFKVIEQYKGEASSDGSAKYQREPHSILLTPGKQYLFFFRGDNFVSVCTGSRIFDDRMDVIHELRALAKQQA
ncbi:hypothetical protein [Agaribacterium haliotis]|uniref:hypothetical protein n=1 Tax=Agaribacterium haliotis TaxID=2013869 RepID=UPI000BB53FFC|nr:hypothetical protein [Agaribacterium haliotis]